MIIINIVSIIYVIPFFSLIVNPSHFLNTFLQLFIDSFFFITILDTSFVPVFIALTDPYFYIINGG